jgi:hypothetical protein
MSIEKVYNITVSSTYSDFDLERFLKSKNMQIFMGNEYMCDITTIKVQPKFQIVEKEEKMSPEKSYKADLIKQATIIGNSFNDLK